MELKRELKLINLLQDKVAEIEKDVNKSKDNMKEWVYEMGLAGLARLLSSLEARTKKEIEQEEAGK